jgi:hypothetical protein
MSLTHKQPDSVIETIAYCNEFAGCISQWNFITLRVQYTTLDYSQQLYNTRPNSTSPLTQLDSSLEKLSPVYHTAVSIVMLPFSVVLLQ